LPEKLASAKTIVKIFLPLFYPLAIAVVHLSEKISNAYATLIELVYFYGK